jgi:uncharacterized membrane protein
MEKTMMRRVTGLVILLILLIPPVGAVLGWVTISGFVSDMQQAASARIAAVNERLEHVDERMTSVQAAASAISQNIDLLIADINAIAETISSALNVNIAVPLPELPDLNITLPVINANLSIPMPDLGTLNLEIPGLQQVRDFFEDIFGYFTEMGSLLRDVAEIQTVATDLGAAAGEAAELADDIASVAAEWSGTLIPLAGLCLGWAALLWLAAVARWLKEGWQMLMGK